MPTESRSTVLVIDDEPDLCDLMAQILGDEYAVRTAANAEKGLERVRTERVHCILLDLTLPGMDGLEFLRRLGEADQLRRTRVIMLTATRDVQAAVQAMQLGAADYKTKPLNPDELRLAVAREVERARQEDRFEALSASAQRKVDFDQFITRSPSMRAVLELARRVCDSDARVMVTGETGTGKELLARALHDNSLRRDAPFVAVNCAAIPADLAESEFFGHEKGAFTGALKQKRGRFELAHGGTLFLDEMICLPLDLQAKLLRVLQDGTVDRVGGETPVRVDVRVIAATNVDVHAEVLAGRFREDLYYRLNVVPLHVPPLRERREDIPILLDHFRELQSRRLRKEVRKFAPDALRMLCAYDWPGNVRELEHTVERLVILERSGEIGTDHLPMDILGADRGERSEVGPGGARPLKQAREEFERRYIQNALARLDWNQTRAAAALGINRNTLIAKMHQLGLKTPKKVKVLGKP